MNWITYVNHGNEEAQTQKPLISRGKQLFQQYTLVWLNYMVKHLGINRFWIRVSSSPYGKHHLLFIWINLKFINVCKKARSTVVSTSNHRVISIPTHKIIQNSRLYLPVIMYRLLSVLVWDVPAFQQTRAKKENNGYTMAYSTIWLTIPGEFKNNLNVRLNYSRLVSMTPHNCKIWKNLQKTLYVKTAKYV